MQNPTVPETTRSKCTHVDSGRPNICANLSFWIGSNRFLRCSVSDHQTCVATGQLQQPTVAANAGTFIWMIHHKAWIRHSARPSPEQSASVARSTRTQRRAICTLVSGGGVRAAAARRSPRCWKGTGAWMQRLLEPPEPWVSFWWVWGSLEVKEN